MIEVLDMRDVSTEEIQNTISYMQRHRDDIYGGDKYHFDLAIEALRRWEVRNEYDQ